MLRIAVLDDVPAERERIEGLSREYAALRGVSADIRGFLHPDALITACEKDAFHIYLLDMVMPMLSGLDVARNIRRSDTGAQILFITTEPGFALDAYQVNPLHYLIKPVDRAALFSALDLAAQRTDFGREIEITVKTKDGIRTFPADMIVCCEYSRHTVLYTLAGGGRVETTTVCESFANHVAPLLKDRQFIQPHAAFVVNMRYAEKLNRDGFTLQGGALVPVSGKLFSNVRSAYMSYRLGET